MAIYPLLERLKKLISALSAGQKREFRRYIQSLGGDDTRDVKLFDAINLWLKRKKFPEGFLAELKTRKVIHRPEEFSVVAGILYEKILESMRGIPKTRSVRNQIRGIITDIQFLADTELYTEALTLLDKARDLSLKYDYSACLLELLSIEREILFRARHADFFKRLDEIRLDEKALLTRLETDQAIYSLNVEAIQRLVNNTPLSGASVAALDKWRDKLTHNTDIIYELPFRTQRRLFLALLNDIDHYAGLPADAPENRMYYARLTKELYDRYPQFKKEEPDLYIQHLGAFLSFALEQGSWQVFEEAKCELDDLEGSAGFFRWVVPVYLHWYYQSESYEAGCRFIEERDLFGQIEHFREKMISSRYVNICFTAFELFWLNQQPEKALNWLNRIVAFKSGEFPRDLQCNARFLLIPVLYDCGVFKTHENPHSIIQGLQRWLRKYNYNGPLYHFLMVVVKEIALKPGPFYKAPAVVKAIRIIEQELKNASDSLRLMTLLLVWHMAIKHKIPLSDALKQFKRLSV